MKRYCFTLIGLSVLVFILTSTSYGWEGRMGGMGDPYGLIADESDFLVHPAKIAQGEGVRFYGDYRFTYTGVTDWDYDLNWFNNAGIFGDYFYYETSGQEYRHNALLGAATPLGPGRFGLFFAYDGMRGDYDGDEDVWGMINAYKYDLSSDLDNFSLRLLYGIPVGGLNLGGEVQFSYRGEENENQQQKNDLSVAWSNNIDGIVIPTDNLLPFQFPYDSSYWQALLKGSLEGMVGPFDLEFTLRGGFIFAGDNNLETARTIFIPGSFDADGDVQGWKIGGDLWVKYPLAGNLALPFLVRVDYKEKSRDGDGPGMLNWSTNNYTYENEERDLQVMVGGGVDKELGSGTRVAGGIYYNYRQGVKYIRLHDAFIGFWIDYDSSDYPASTEQQIIVRIAGEHEFSPLFTLRMGLGLFYGWVREDFEFVLSDSLAFLYTDDISVDGFHWGIGGSLGGSLSFNSFTVEPFFNVGWQQIDLHGNGGRIAPGVILGRWDMALSRSEWSIGGGLSVLFGL